MEDFIKKLEEIAKGDLVLGKSVICNDEISLIPIYKVKLNYTNLESKIKGEILGLSGGVNLVPLGIIEVKRTGIKVHTLKDSLSDIVQSGPDLFDMVGKIFTVPKES